MTDLPAPVQAFIDTTNAGDSEAFVAVFTDDAHLEDWGRVFRGHDGARSWNASDNIGKRSPSRSTGWLATVTSGSSP